jgi:uncharacterized membrane protein
MIPRVSGNVAGRLQVAIALEVQMPRITLSDSPPDVPAHINENIEAISDMDARAEREVTPHQRGIDRLTSLLGRPYFLYGLVTFVCLWTGLNVWLPTIGERAFDPPPFSLLQGVATLCALLMTTMVLITQRHQLNLAGKRSHLELQVSLLVEGKVAKVISLLEELRRDLPNVSNRSDPEAKAMEARMDTRAVAEALEQSIETEVEESE